MTTKYCPQCQHAYQEPQRFCPTDGELLSLRDPYNLVGRTIAEKYHVKALIGIGGMGVVYNAQHLSLDRRVAIKILQPNIALKNLHTLDLFQIDGRSDVYSLGIMLYEMLTGKLPFNAPSFQGLVRLHLTAPPPSIRHFRPELPVAIEQLTNQLMAKAPEQRPQLAVVPSLFEQAFENIYEPQRKGRESFLTADNERGRGQIEEAYRRQDVSRANVEEETEKLSRLERERAPNLRHRLYISDKA